MKISDQLRGPPAPLGGPHWAFSDKHSNRLHTHIHKHTHTHNEGQLAASDRRKCARVSRPLRVLARVRERLLPVWLMVSIRPPAPGRLIYFELQLSLVLYTHHAGGKVKDKASFGLTDCTNMKKVILRFFFSNPARWPCVCVCVCVWHPEICEVKCTLYIVHAVHFVLLAVSWLMNTLRTHRQRKKFDILHIFILGKDGELKLKKLTPQRDR